MYQVTEPFYDYKLKREYKAGDAYPGQGPQPKEDWIDKLAGRKNRLARPVIKWVEPISAATDKAAEEARTAALEKTPRRK